MDDLAETVETYETVAEEYHERHADRGVVAEMLERFLDRCDGPRILDAGCGPGWESAAMTAAGHDVVGVDLTPAFLDIATEEAPDADFVRGDMRRLPFAENAFDGLWACASFLHVPRDDAPETLEAFRRVLRPGGTFFCAVKQGTGTKTGSGYEADERAFVLWQPEDLRAVVENAGFEVDRLDSGDWVHVYART